MTEYPPPERALELVHEFTNYVSSQKSSEDYRYFIDELKKLHPDDKHKVFYNIAQKFKEMSR